MLTTRLSYREVCTILHVPNFSVFSAGRRPELGESLCCSTAVKLWSAFAQTERQLRTEIEASPPINWHSLTEGNQFSRLVSRYCDLMESQSHAPTESRARLAHDNETLTGNTERNDGSPRSNQETLFELDELDWTYFMRSYDP